MRTTSWMALTSSLALCGAAAHALGCGLDAADCDLALTCASYADAGGRTPVVACTAPSLLTKGGPEPSCGVFASASAAPGGDGSKTAPLNTLQAAVNLAATTGKPVYACAEEFDEGLQIPSGVTVYGGLDCAAGWAWKTGRRTLVNAPASATAGGATEVAVRLEAGTAKTVLQDLDVTAPTGKLPGVSSVAVLVEDTAAELTRGTLTAGDGVDGAKGTELATDPGLDGLDGDTGFNICGAPATNPGPAGPIKACGAQPSQGGAGGDGGPPNGASAGDGQAGTPPESGASGAGLGGAGQSTSCQPGVKGADGAAGVSGKGASGKGDVSASGYGGVAGHDGTAGRPGQGGGGGGGAKGKLQVVCSGLQTMDRPGATGGTGGTGGCGGARGGGGRAGGSSIALLSLATHALTLTEIALAVGDGGNGGDGGGGQTGGSNGSGANGGQGANGASAGCTGGDGGLGGAGGPGGGGIGGHAIGVAFKGTAPAGLPVVSYKGMKATPGLGGGPGAGSMVAAGTGADGLAGDLVDFGAP